MKYKKHTQIHTQLATVVCYLKLQANCQRKPSVCFPPWLFERLISPCGQTRLSLQRQQLFVIVSNGCDCGCNAAFLAILTTLCRLSRLSFAASCLCAEFRAKVGGSGRSHCSLGFRRSFDGRQLIARFVQLSF